MSASRLLGAAAFSAVLVLSACGGPKENAPVRPSSEPATQTPPPGGAPPPTPATATAPGPTGTASISGKVTFEGTVPAAETVKLSSDAYCAGAHPKGMEKGDLVVSSDKGVANVFVYVKDGIAGSYPVPSAAVVLDQNGCAYRPHVFGLRAGQPLEIVNDDDTLHNVHAMAERNASFNVGMPVPHYKVVKTFAKPEVMVKFKCDVHGWMSAYAGVLPHPFFAVTGPDGSFAIKDLPAGTYTVEAWHERLGTQTQKVTVGGGESKSAGFAFRSPA